MRHTTSRHPAKKAKVLLRKIRANKVTRAYKSSVKSIKNHPIQSLGILTLGAGLVSGAYMLYKHNKH